MMYVHCRSRRAGQSVPPFKLFQASSESRTVVFQGQHAYDFWQTSPQTKTSSQLLGISFRRFKLSNRSSGFRCSQLCHDCAKYSALFFSLECCWTCNGSELIIRILECLSCNQSVEWTDSIRHHSSDAHIPGSQIHVSRITILYSL